MDDPLRVRRFQRFGDLLGDRQRFVEWDGAAKDSPGEILARDQLHDKSAHPTGFFDAVNVRDVRMIQRREDLRFTLKTRHAIGVGGEELRQDFQRDVATELRVLRTIYLAHAARAEQTQDFIRAKASA